MDNLVTSRGSSLLLYSSSHYYRACASSTLKPACLSLSCPHSFHRTFLNSICHFLGVVDGFIKVQQDLRLCLDKYLLQSKRYNYPARRRSCWRYCSYRKLGLDGRKVTMLWRLHCRLDQVLRFGEVFLNST